MNRQITLIFDRPPTTNEILNTARTHRMVAAIDKQRLTLRIAQAAKLQYPCKIEFKPYLLEEIGYRTNSSDIDNLTGCLKYVMDGVVKAGILDNDNLAHTRNSLYVHARKTSKNDTLLVQLKLFESAKDYIEQVSSLIEG